MMKIEPSGVAMMGSCDVMTESCAAKRAPAPIMVVWSPRRQQINVCTPCLNGSVPRNALFVAVAKLHDFKNI